MVEKFNSVMVLVSASSRGCLADFNEFSSAGVEIKSEQASVGCSFQLKHQRSVKLLDLTRHSEDFKECAKT